MRKVCPRSSADSKQSGSDGVVVLLVMSPPAMKQMPNSVETLFVLQKKSKGIFPISVKIYRAASGSASSVTDGQVQTRLRSP